MADLHNITLVDEDGNDYVSRILVNQYWPYSNGGIALTNDDGTMTICNHDGWKRLSFGEFYKSENTDIYSIDGEVYHATNMSIEPTAGTLVLDLIEVETHSDETVDFNGAATPKPVLKARLMLARSEWKIVEYTTRLRDGQEPEDIPKFTYVVDAGLSTEATYEVANFQYDARFEGALMQEIEYDEKAKAYKSCTFLITGYTTIEMDTGEPFDEPKSFSIDGEVTVTGTRMQYEQTNGVIQVIGSVSIPTGDGQVDANGQPQMVETVKKHYISRMPFGYVTITER